jgi:hypothetical protein
MARGRVQASRTSRSTVGTISGRSSAIMPGPAARAASTWSHAASSTASRSTCRRAAESVKQGQRNESLWYYCMTQARHCDDVAALVDVAATWAQAFPDPLPTSEVERCALSAWKYEANGRNFLGLRKPQITAGDKIMDGLLDHPEAYTLLQMFLRWHGNRQSFAIAPTAMSEAGSPPWPRRRIERARDILLQRGFIEELAAPIRGKKSGQYRLSAQIGRFAKDHSTPFPR